MSIGWEELLGALQRGKAATPPVAPLPRFTPQDLNFGRAIHQARAARRVAELPIPEAAQEAAAPAAEASLHADSPEGRQLFETYLRDAQSDLLNREKDLPDVRHRSARMESWWRKALTTPEPLSDEVRQRLTERPGWFMLKAYDKIHPATFPESYQAAQAAEAVAPEVGAVVQEAAREPSTTWAHGSDVSLKPAVAEMVNQQHASRNINRTDRVKGIPESYDALTDQVRRAPVAEASGPVKAERTIRDQELLSQLGTGEDARNLEQSFVPTAAERLLLEHHGYTPQQLHALRGAVEEERPAMELSPHGVGQGGLERYATPADMSREIHAIDAEQGVRGVGTATDPENIATQRHSAIQLARAALRQRGVSPAQIQELQDLSQQLAVAPQKDVQALARAVTENAPTRARYQPELGRNVLEYPAIAPAEGQSIRDIGAGLSPAEHELRQAAFDRVTNTNPAIGTERQVRAARTDLDRTAEAAHGSFPPFHEIAQNGALRSRLAKDLLDEWSVQDYHAAKGGTEEFQKYHHAMTSKGKSVDRELSDYTDGWNRMALGQPGADNYILHLAHAADRGTPLNQFERELVHRYENMQ